MSVGQQSVRIQYQMEQPPVRYSLYSNNERADIQIYFSSPFPLCAISFLLLYLCFTKTRIAVYYSRHDERHYNDTVDPAKC